MTYHDVECLITECTKILLEEGDRDFETPEGWKDGVESLTSTLLVAHQTRAIEQPECLVLGTAV